MLPCIELHCNLNWMIRVECASIKLFLINFYSLVELHLVWEKKWCEQKEKDFLHPRLNWNFVLWQHVHRCMRWSGIQPNLSASLNSSDPAVCRLNTQAEMLSHRPAVTSLMSRFLSLPLLLYDSLSIILSCFSVTASLFLPPSFLLNKAGADLAGSWDSLSVFSWN